MLGPDPQAYILLYQYVEFFFSISASLVTKFLFIYLKKTLFYSANLIFFKFILLTCIDILTYKIIELCKSYPIIKT